MEQSTRSGWTYRNKLTDEVCYYNELVGTQGAISTHHYLSALAARDILKAGGNAVDAAVAATFVEGVLNANMFTIGGECPILVKMANSDRVISINGNTAAPALANPREFINRGFKSVPDEGVLAAGVPAAFGALLTALREFGRLDFSDVISHALSLAKNGFPASAGLVHEERSGLIDLKGKFLSRWPGSANLYLKNGEPPEQGELLKNPALAAMYDYLAGIESGKKKEHRANRLTAVMNGFYRGDVAGAIDAFCREKDGLLRKSDLEVFETKLENPISLEFGSSTVYKCGPWTQGAALLQSLSILKGFDLSAMGHNSADYLHHVIEAVKLAFADREQHYADPDFVDVPIDQLLSDRYGQLRAELISPLIANSELRPGDPLSENGLLAPARRFTPKPWGAGTVHVDVVDSEGNMVAATPSGGWLRSSEVIPRLGFPLSCRMMTFYLTPDNHPNVVAPFKRPRTTISPTLAFHNGKPWMAFGSMGGDQQDQWMLQFFLNRAVFGMSIQKAIEAAKFSSEHFPGFFAPHARVQNLVRIEPRVRSEVLRDLAVRGHQIELAPDWSEGFLAAAGRDLKTGLFEAGCDPRGAKSQIFPACALAW